MAEGRIETNKRQRTAQMLTGIGCAVLLAGSSLHLILGYPRVSAALAGSNLNEDFRNALRSVFLLIGFTWVILVFITWIATFVASRISKPIILFCGFGLLLQIPIWVGLMGWFVGNEMFVLGAGLIACGGLLFQSWRSV